jgi:hypothetical protein
VELIEVPNEHKYKISEPCIILTINSFGDALKLTGMIGVRSIW